MALFLKILEIFHSIQKQVLNMLPHELLYRASMLFKKYWKTLIKPVLVITSSGSFLYLVMSLYFSWPFNPIVILILFLVIFDVFIVIGCLQGENQKEVYFHDD